MFTLAVVFMGAITFVSLLGVGGAWLAFKSDRCRSLRSPFDCGFNPIIGSREPISVRFFIIAVLFVVFDVEVIILLPILTGVARLPQLLFLSYLLILFGGLLHEWREGTLEWQN